MACCLFLLRLLAPLSARLGLATPSTVAPRFPIVPAAVLGLVEICAAWLVVNLGSTAAATTSPSSGMHDHAMHDHGTAMPGMAADSMTGGRSALVLVATAILVFGIAMLGRRAAGRRSAPLAVLGSVAAVAISLIALTPTVAGTHLLLMAVIEVCLVLAPLAIVGTRRRDEASDDVWTVARAAIAGLTAAAAAFLLITLHLHVTHDWYRGPDGLAWWLAPTLMTVGLGFWSSMLRFRLPQAVRSVLFVVVLETGAVIGLVLLVANHAVMDMSPGLGLGVLVDQRLAGALMMAIDLVLLAWVVDGQLNGSRQTSTRPSTTIVAATTT